MTAHPESPLPRRQTPRTAIIACGALAREVLQLRERYGWEAEVVGVPVLLHNHPHKIAPAVRRRIREVRREFDRVVVVYGDCGSSGALDLMLAEEGVERIAGPHCYEIYAGREFDRLMHQAPGTFFLTDYLVGSFDHLVLENLGIDRYPELLQDYFGNYTRVVYLAQREDPGLLERARWAADQLGLPLEVRPVGLGALETRLVELMKHD